MPTSDRLFAFGPFLLDPDQRTLTRDGQRVSIGAAPLDVLCTLVSRAGQLVPKDTLAHSASRDGAMTSTNVEQAVSTLRKALELPSGQPMIQTRMRRGVRFVGKVEQVARPRNEPPAFDEMLDANRAWIEGRAWLEPINTRAIAMARAAFGDMVSQQRDNPLAHVGLANACALQFEITRADAEPDRAALEAAHDHAREACRLDPRNAEAWATLGFVLERLGNREDAVNAHRESVLLEPENWRHHLRFAAASWGEERIREARRTLQLQPGLPAAHWLAASVLVGRQRLDDAQFELEAGLAQYASEHDIAEKLRSPGLHWVLGLLFLARGHNEGAFVAFGRELQQEDSGRLYAREVAAHTWYAIGAMRFREGNRDAARGAFQESLRRVGTHPLASAALGLFQPATALSPLDRAIADAVRLITRPGGADPDTYLPAIERALLEAPPGHAGWLLPIEPMLSANVSGARWAQILARLNTRSA